MILPVGNQEDNTDDVDDVDAFANRVLQAILGAQQVQAAWLGDKLGWYQTLASEGPLTTGALAEKTCSSERYAREWCEHQTVSGWISCQDPLADVKDRLYFLSSSQQAVLTNPDSLSLTLPACKFVASCGTHLEQLQQAYRTDGGVSWDEFGADVRESQAAGTRPLLLHRLGQEFIPSGLPEVHQKLQVGGRVADIGAGMGWSSIGVARAYPNARVDAYDLYQPSVEQAKRNIVAAGLDDRVKAHCVDVGTLIDQDEKYDLVMALECIHDLSHPVAVLRNMRKLAGGTGTVMVMDDNVPEHFTGDSSSNNDIEKLMYGFSIQCCLADCKSRPNSAETGTVMRQSQLQRYAMEAGFREVETLPVKHNFFRFYRLNQ